MKVAVTGASGFVGGAVCRAAVAAGHDVTAYGRRDSIDFAHVGGAPYCSWDIARGPLPASRCPAETDTVTDVVVHCAGSVTDWGGRSAMLKVNRDGTRHVLDTFPAARFIHISTASVYDPRVPTVRAGETEASVTAPLRHRDAYGQSKAAAEHVVRTARPDAVILRPHAVYGPGDTTLLPRLLASIRGASLFAVGDGNQLLSLTSIDNLVRACLLAATAPPSVTGIFNITDEDPVRLDDALRAFLAARRIAATPRYLPFRVALPLAAAAEAAAHLTGRAPRLTRYSVRHLALERTLDLTAARERLGYQPTPTTFDGAADW